MMTYATEPESRMSTSHRSKTNELSARGPDRRVVRIKTRDGVRLRHLDWGTGSPILFINSWSFTVNTWARTMYYFSGRGYRCLSFDRRGHGRSDDPGYGYDFDTLADDLADVIEQLELRDVTLVGHSMGCGEIIRYLTRHSSAPVARIVLTSTTTPLLTKTEDNPLGVDPLVLQMVRNNMCTDFPQWLVDNAPPFVVEETSKATINWIINESQQTSLKALLDCNWAVVSTDFRSELRSIRVPALILHGDADVSTPLHLTGRPTAALLPGSELKVYEGAPHGLPFTHADKIHSDLARFFSDERAKIVTGAQELVS
jgi:non-heme chloroperoxidase